MVVVRWRCRIQFARPELANSDQAKNRQKSQKGVSPDLAVQIKPVLFQCLPHRVKLEPEQALAICGGLTNMRCASVEQPGLATLRYVIEGGREVVWARYDDVHAWHKAFEQDAKAEPKKFSTKVTPTQMVTDFFAQKIPPEAFKLIEDVGGEIYKGTTHMNSLIYTPSGSVVVDRTISGATKLTFMTWGLVSARALGGVLGTKLRFVFGRCLQRRYLRLVPGLAAGQGTKCGLTNLRFGDP